MTANQIVLVVSVSIIKDEEVLMIKENKSDVRNKWNFPGGQVETGEDILYAARREVKEETGLDVELTYTTGIYNFISSSQDQVIMFHFIGQVTGGSINLVEDEIIDSTWVKVSDLVKSNDDSLRNPSVIKQIAYSLVNKSYHPINVFHKQVVNKQKFIITPYIPKYAEQTVEMWRDSKERAIGQKENHSFESHVHFLNHILPKQYQIDLALMDEKVVGIVAYNEKEISQLYIHTGYQGMGIGQTFLQKVKEQSSGRLTLYTFEVNENAQRFYEKNGFTIIGRGDENEENLPDIHYEWTLK